MRPLHGVKIQSIHLAFLVLLFCLGASLYGATAADTLLPPMSTNAFITSDGRSVGAQTLQADPAGTTNMTGHHLVVGRTGKIEIRVFENGQFGCRYMACFQNPDGCDCDGFFCGDVFICGIPCRPTDPC